MDDNRYTTELTTLTKYMLKGYQFQSVRQPKDYRVRNKNLYYSADGYEGLYAVE